MWRHKKWMHQVRCKNKNRNCEGYWESALRSADYEVVSWSSQHCGFKENIFLSQCCVFVHGALRVKNILITFLQEGKV